MRRAFDAHSGVAYADLDGARRSGTGDRRRGRLLDLLRRCLHGHGQQIHRIVFASTQCSTSFEHPVRIHPMLHRQTRHRYIRLAGQLGQMPSKFDRVIRDAFA
ncbi:putative transposase domain protein [Burkholderia pseudomallei MSHR4378]|nr:putative transposase domain protein [Burkholderia pseudomallei MSHR4378]